MGSYTTNGFYMPSMADREINWGDLLVGNMTLLDPVLGMMRGTPFVNPMDKTYGALGDGSTDDHAAIQSALDTGLDVVLPGKVFVVGSTLTLATSQQRLILGEATLQAKSGFAANTPIVDVNGGRYGQVIGGIIDGNSGAATWGIRLVQPNDSGGEAHNYAWNSRVKGCSGASFIAGASDGSLLGQGCHIIMCRFHSNTSNTVTANGIEHYGVDSMIYDNRGAINAGNGIILGSSTVSAGGMQVRGNHIFANQATSGSSPLGIQIKNGNIIQIVGNYLDSFQQGNMISAVPGSGAIVSEMLILGNTFLANGLYTVANPPVLSDATVNCIQLSNASGGTIEGITVADNIARNNDSSHRWKYLVNLVGPPAAVVVHGNNIKNVSALYSATTPAYTAGNAWYNGTSWAVG